MTIIIVGRSRQTSLLFRLLMQLSCHDMCKITPGLCATTCSMCHDMFPPCFPFRFTAHCPPPPLTPTNSSETPIRCQLSTAAWKRQGSLGKASISPPLLRRHRRVSAAILICRRPEEAKGKEKEKKRSPPTARPNARRLGHGRARTF